MQERVMNDNPNLENWLNEFRRTRIEEPQFYYNELAERARAAGRLRPLLENFLNNRLSFADFKSQVAAESRHELKAARGRESGHYWRLNASGRLFLESYFKTAERANRLNAASQALVKALTVPANLDQAGQQFEAFDFFLGELLASGVQAGMVLTQGFIPYFLSYFWAVQESAWPIYGREVRTELVRLGLLTAPATNKATRSPGNDYTRFYLAFSRLAQQLELNTWELESFLNWLASRDFSPTRLLPSRRKASRRSGGNFERLRLALESRLQSEIAPGLRGLLSGPDRLIFQESACPVRLELRLTSSGPLAGIAFDGLSKVALSGSEGSRVLEELNGFLSARPDYHFYDSALAEAEPDLRNLAAEFFLLRPLEATTSRKATGPDLPDLLLSEWRSLYPFARRLIAPFEDAPVSAGSLTYQTYEETSAQTPELAVAEEGTLYQVEAAEAVEAFLPSATKPASTANLQLYDEAVPAEPATPSIANRQVSIAEAEVQKIAHLKPPPLTTEQIEGLLVFVRERLVVTPEKVREILTHLEAGRNVLLFGPPGSGKTRLARLLAGQLCSPDPGWTAENEATNYSLATAGPEWSSYDVIGGIRPGLATETSRESDKLTYYFEPGVVARAALECERSLARAGRPHYLIIDEFNRANQERAFGELFTVLEYRDRPLLPGARLGRFANLYLPDAFRIIGTMNSEDRNTLFEPGLALRRRFALVELDLPPPAEERRFLPKAVQARLPAIKLTPTGEFADPQFVRALDQLLTFAAAVRPDPANPAAGGKKLGTAPLIEALLFCGVATRFYHDPTEALEDAIAANLLPQLERAPQAIARALAAMEPGGPLAGLTRVRAILQRMSGTNTFFN